MERSTRGSPADAAIRPIRDEDVPQVRALHARSFTILARDHHTPEQLTAHADLVCAPDYAGELLSNHLLVAEDPTGCIIGTAGWCMVASASAGEPVMARIRKVYVAPEAAGHGLATRLVRRAENLAQEAGLVHFIVRANANATGFYQRLGYRAVRRGTMPAANGVALPVVFMERPPD